MTDKNSIIIHRDDDIPVEPVLSRRVAIIGYGNQGHAHALNLRDSDVDVVIGLRPEGTTRVAAEQAGFTVLDIREAAASAEVVAILVPDDVIPDVFTNQVAPELKPRSHLLFAHGGPVHFGALPLGETYDVILVAPMGPGRLLRDLYVKGSGLNAKAAVHRDVTGEAWSVALAYARALGCGRLGVITTTFASEAVLDLFSEQAVLCGGIPALAEAAFDTLVEAGYPPALAYIECIREIKYIADLLFEIGLSGMRERISFTALYGAATRGRRIVDERAKENLSKILVEIQDGSFFKELLNVKKTRAELLAELKNEELERGRSEYETRCLL